MEMLQFADPGMSRPLQSSRQPEASVQATSQGNVVHLKAQSLPPVQLHKSPEHSAAHLLALEHDTVHGEVLQVNRQVAALQVQPPAEHSPMQALLPEQET